MADDQGWGQVGYNGHPHLKTPHLDAMAASGIRFNRFYAAAPVCSPTRASVLTGRLPARTGVPGLHKRLCLQEKTLPEALRKAGYATAHFGKWHLNGVKGSGMPILPDDPNHPGHYGFDLWLSATNYFDVDPLMSRNGQFECLEGESSELMVREALKFIGENRARPTFTVIWYGSPHFPFNGRPEDRQGFPEGKHGDQLGEIVALDRSVGMLRKGLRDLGIEKNTLIWYTSDNGGLSTDPDSVGGLKGFKGSLNEGGIRVPGIIEWPGRVKPAVTDFPASTMDIMPTLVDLLDLPEDSMLAVHDGESIVPLLEGAVPERRRPLPFLTKGTALIDGAFKLLSDGKGRDAKWSLFNLEEDPGETTDASADHPDRVAQMKAEVEKVVASVQASAEGKDYPEGRVTQPQRGDSWSEMEEYRRHYDTFQKLKPGWEPPQTKRKSGKRDSDGE
ncbi:sulfatase-like hydrolase/transferase [Verrucomicrobiaceae bacterium E54]|nr:sulfatase-like hydrolase/transferase [Verrucomicrobiaceae bacterium E54]